jgi:hypothetical protein
MLERIVMGRFEVGIDLLVAVLLLVVLFMLVVVLKSGETGDEA